MVEGESKHDEIENQLAKSSTITVPTITLEGDANGAPHLGQQCLCQQILRKIFAPGDQRRYRPQSASGSPTRLCSGCSRCRPLFEYRFVKNPTPALKADSIIKGSSRSAWRLERAGNAQCRTYGHKHRLRRLRRSPSSLVLDHANYRP